MTQNFKDIKNDVQIPDKSNLDFILWIQKWKMRKEKIIIQ